MSHKSLSTVKTLFSLNRHRIHVSYNLAILQKTNKQTKKFFWHVCTLKIQLWHPRDGKPTMTKHVLLGCPHGGAGSGDPVKTSGSKEERRKVVNHFITHPHSRTGTKKASGMFCSRGSVTPITPRSLQQSCEGLCMSVSTVHLLPLSDVKWQYAVRIYLLDLWSLQFSFESLASIYKA